MPAIEFDRELVRKYGGRGPRYTSYPTAVQFHERFAEPDYRRHAQHSNEDPIPRPLSIYTHIPFCESLCYYCACTKIITHNRERVQRYLDDLYAETAMRGALMDGDRAVVQLHLGGGTPSYLTVEQLAGLMEHFGRHFSLCRDGQQEFSIEIDPRSVTVESMPRLTEMGFNRLSMGVQDFDPRVQKAVNRLQPAAETLELLEVARRSGFRSVSLDLIYGLPLQSMQSFARTVDMVVEARPERLAVYSYAHLPQTFRSQRLIDEADLPAPEEKLAIIEQTVARLSEAGYVYIGMDHFALPDDDLAIAQREGTLQRNFQGYSTGADCDLIGLGISAISRLGGSYSQNVKGTREYGECIAAGHLPIDRGLELSAEDELRAAVIQGLMCYGRLRYEQIEREFQVDFEAHFAAELERLAPLQRDGLVERSDSGISITPKGRLLLRVVALVFDAYLVPDSDRQRFSKLV